VLQCVAVCCSVLQCVAVCCSVLLCAAVCCSVLLCAAVCCSVLQCAAVSVCCRVVQCVAVCCSVLRSLGVVSLQRYNRNARNSRKYYKTQAPVFTRQACRTTVIRCCRLLIGRAVAIGLHLQVLQIVTCKAHQGRRVHLVG